VRPLLHRFRLVGWKELRSRADLYIRRRLIRRLGLSSDESYHLDSFMVSPRQDVERIAIYAEPCAATFSMPVDGTLATHSYRTRFVYALEKAIVDPVSSLVYDRGGRFIAESSSWSPIRQLYSCPRPTLPSPRRLLRGESILLPTNGYYHWLLEDLPAFLNSLQVAPDARVLVKRDPPPYVRDVLALLVNEIEFLEAPVGVERLIMTGKTAGYGSPHGSLTPHPRDVETLRRFFAPWIAAAPVGSRLYLSRAGYKRSPLNEPELAAVAERNGFSAVDTGRMDLLSQVRLFSEASQVVGLHGAAFANLAWVAGGTSVREVFDACYVPCCYACLASLRNAEYQALVYRPSECGSLRSEFLYTTEGFFTRPGELG
jgi:hypothetical protein